MRILHVFHHYKPCRGGIESVILELNRQLSRKGHQCSVLCLNSCPRGREKLKARETFKEASVERIPFLDLHCYKLAPFSLGKLRGFDVVHVHGLGFFSDYLALTKPLHRKRLLLSTHGGIFHTNRISLLKGIYFSAWCRLVLKAFSKIVAVSSQDKELFSKIAGKRKIAVIENGIDWKGLSGLKREVQRNAFLYFGRLSRNKGLRELIGAFALLCREKKDAKLLLAGQDFDTLLPALRRQARQLGIEKNVSFLGEVSDNQLQQLLSKAEFFVSASQYEGFGIAAVEAMAAGLVPVLSRIDSFERFVRHGENGFLVEFSDTEKAAEQLKVAAGLRNSERKRLGKNAKRFAAAFDWGKKVEEYLAAYRGVAK